MNEIGSAMETASEIKSVMNKIIKIKTKAKVRSDKKSNCSEIYHA